ncbi:nuclear receptor subfamily 2 group C member 1 isoform X9 [Ornithorhynchus anatinus]|uniref:nuclear receptor subfamily 2 group C member 1 isoform X9 n=1 Tax=Ornithorhynchus anatinus TaxID=9258 RepID=UPI0019D47343|nr:nuclear receptor subfamily 2 group C member 1 isoform X9 [Ornithorhynchus anatinus]
MIAQSQGAVMDGTAQRIQIVPADSGLALPQRIQPKTKEFLFLRDYRVKMDQQPSKIQSKRRAQQIVTDQQTGQKIQIVTALDQSTSSKQFILTNHDSANPSKVILARQESTPGKVFLATPDASGVNQLFFATPDLSAQHIQILTDNSSTDQTPNKIFDLCVVCGDKASAVQCERKPIEVSREKSSNCAASTEKIYIRKDLRSPLAATPTFVTDSETARSTGLLDSGMFVNIHQSGVKSESAMLMAQDKAEACQGDLSTLANVVTSLASLGKAKDISQSSSTDLSMIESLSNGDTSLSEIQPEEQASSDVTRAFDTLAKALNPGESAACQNSVENMEASVHLIAGESSMNIVEIEGPLLSDAHVAFRLTMPSPMPEYLNVHYICESASRLLFLSMHWARSIPSFQALGQENSISLVKACWNELFTLGLAQCSQVMNVATILTAFVNHLHSSLQQDKLSSERGKLVMEHIFKLQEFCNSMVKLCLDGYEYAYLKAIVLFSPDHPGLENMGQIEKFQEKAYMEFQDYITKAYPDDTYRLSRLLLRLPALRLMSATITEELFFAGLIGNVQIDSIIPYILRMETADYNSQIIGHGI